jgi:hypothetical protein
MIAVLGGLADAERDLIRTRTAEGRSRANAEGQHMGRPTKLTPQQQKEARRRLGRTSASMVLVECIDISFAVLDRNTNPAQAKRIRRDLSVNR